MLVRQASARLGEDIREEQAATWRFPTTDMPGHHRLYERATIAINTESEAENRFQRVGRVGCPPMSYPADAAGNGEPSVQRIRRHRRQRAVIVDFAGISDEHYATHKRRRHRCFRGSKRLLVIAVDEFNDVPIMCTRVHIPAASAYRPPFT